MHDTKLVLVGCITEVSNPDSYSDQEERVTVSVDGAEPLYSELRLQTRTAGRWAREW